MSSVRGYLGIDNGTQGISIIFADEKQLHVLATGESSFGFVPELPDGCYEQLTEHWDKALSDAMQQIHQQIANIQVLAIGISGQMHGEVLVGENGNSLSPVRLWCDARNEEEGLELTSLFNTKVPKRSTVSRFLWTIRNRPDLANQTKHITTPAGWISFRLTGKWTLGIGDASGMFPIDQDTLDYNDHMLQLFDELNINSNVAPLKTILSNVIKAGDDAGMLSKVGAALLGLTQGIPVAAAEGDQPAALAGSLIASAGMVSMSFGTSVVSNSVGDKAFCGVDKAVDHFCAVDGKPINMVWLRNGTTFMNTVVETFSDANGFESVMPKLVEASPDCGGLLALPFMDDEPGVNVSEGGTAMICGWNPDNATAGNVAKAALLSTIFNLKLGSNVLEQQGYPQTEIVLSGGLTKTPECGQIVADVFDLPVTLLDNAEEGCAWGAALLARYRYERCNGSNVPWTGFLQSISVKGHTRFLPEKEAVREYQGVYGRYQKLMTVQPMLSEALSE
jgi:sugar (pentulose or hexulose) kinase